MIVDWEIPLFRGMKRESRGMKKYAPIEK